MKYDVFISYSRKDTAIADKVCAAFDRAGISYFIDRQGIGGGFEFPRVLAENIIDSQLFLLLASENAYASKFTNSEIVFAFNKKSKQSILPYIIDGSSLPLELEFTFAGINWRNINDHPIDSVLVADILKLLGKTAKAAQSTSAPVKPQPKVEVKPQPEPVAKTYKVGDYYDDGTKQGVVFDVWDGGRHGKIVSLDQICLCWAENKNFGTVFNKLYPSKVQVGCNDKSDGMVNTRKIQQIDNWKKKYPAFAWCCNKGNDWYLPATDEIKLLLLNDAVHDAVNITLAQKGKIKLFNKGDYGGYWSSTEWDSSGVQFVGLRDGYIYRDYKFTHNGCVRAVATF